MNPVELALAVILLTSCPDGFELQDPAESFRAAAPAIKKLALEWELLDAREDTYLKNAEDFASDLKLLQGRFMEYCNAPKADEVKRFPSRDLLNDMLAFNRRFRDSVNNRLDLDMLHAAELRTVLKETDDLFQVYAAVREARCEYFYVTYRRQALAQLRDLIGVDAFYSGQLPPHVPLWRIPEEK
jgi:hypothetical protein